jgi:hypothetical protein
MFTSINNYQPKKKYQFNPSQTSHNINVVDYRKGLITKQQLLESETSLKNGLKPKVYHNPTIEILSNKWSYKTI